MALNKTVVPPPKPKNARIIELNKIVSSPNELVRNQQETTPTVRVPPRPPQNANLVIQHPTIQHTPSPSYISNTQHQIILQSTPSQVNTVTVHPSHPANAIYNAMGSSVKIPPKPPANSKLVNLTTGTTPTTIPRPGTMPQNQIQDVSNSHIVSSRPSQAVSLPKKPPHRPMNARIVFSENLHNIQPINSIQNIQPPNGQLQENDQIVGTEDSKLCHVMASNAISDVNLSLPQENSIANRQRVPPSAPKSVRVINVLSPSNYSQAPLQITSLIEKSKDDINISLIRESASRNQAIQLSEQVEGVLVLEKSEEHSKIELQILHTTPNISSNETPYDDPLLNKTNEIVPTQELTEINQTLVEQLPNKQVIIPASKGSAPPPPAPPPPVEFLRENTQNSVKKPEKREEKQESKSKESLDPITQPKKESKPKEEKEDFVTILKRKLKEKNLLQEEEKSEAGESSEVKISNVLVEDEKLVPNQVKTESVEIKNTVAVPESSAQVYEEINKKEFDNELNAELKNRRKKISGKQKKPKMNHGHMIQTNSQQIYVEISNKIGVDTSSESSTDNNENESWDDN